MEENKSKIKMKKKSFSQKNSLTNHKTKGGKVSHWNSAENFCYLLFLFLFFLLLGYFIYCCFYYFRYFNFC